MIDHDTLIKRQFEVSKMIDNYEDDLARLYDTGEAEDFYWDEDDGYDYYEQEDEEEFWVEDIISAVQVG